MPPIFKHLRVPTIFFVPPTFSSRALKIVVLDNNNKLVLTQDNFTNECFTPCPPPISPVSNYASATTPSLPPHKIAIIFLSLTLLGTFHFHDITGHHFVIILILFLDITCGCYWHCQAYISPTNSRFWKAIAGTYYKKIRQ